MKTFIQLLKERQELQTTIDRHPLLRIVQDELYKSGSDFVMYENMQEYYNDSVHIGFQCMDSGNDCEIIINGGVSESEDEEAIRQIVKDWLEVNQYN